jgi:hypothetical protein
MSFPSDIFLPSNAKYYAFVDDKLHYNPHWDINWSFEYSLTGEEVGFCTFLTNFSPITGWPGHYLGYSGNAPISSYITTESGEYILTENGERILIESETGIGTNGILAIAFDSSGLFALSSSSRGGVGLNDIRKNSLIIRDGYDNLLVNVQLSSISSTLSTVSSQNSEYNLLRFRYSQAGNKLNIDFKRPIDSKFQLLTSIVQTLVIPENVSNIRVGLCYCSPISSNSITPGTMRIRNFHVQGNTNEENYENTLFVPITASKLTTYTTLSSLTANM